MSTKPVYLETLPGDPAFNLGAHLCEDTGGERLGFGCPGKMARQPHHPPQVPSAWNILHESLSQAQRF